MKMTTFQIVFTGACVALVLAGIAVFALFSGLGGKSTVGKVVIWGTVNKDSIDKVLDQLRPQDDAFHDVVYVQKQADTYVGELVNAMASGTGPDLVLISQHNAVALGDKLLSIPYSTVSQSTFVNSFIDEGRLFLTTQGSVAQPFLIDPLVMYWNRDLFASAGIPNPPRYWSEFITLAPKMTVLDGGANITKSTVALGGWSNILNAKSILATLFLQAGDPITAYNDTGELSSRLGITPQGATENPAASALNFYTGFANPSKTIYSWNRALPEALDDFVAGDLAVYFGFASDYPTLSARNPNLRVGVALLPQIQGSATQLTFGNITGLAIPRTATNVMGAATIAQKLTSPLAITALFSSTGLPPVRRDVPIDTSQSAAGAVFVQSALIARGWLDPNPQATNSIFETMIESVISGQSQPDQAVGEAAQTMRSLLQ